MGKKPVQVGRASARRSGGRGKKRSKTFGLYLVMLMVMGAVYLFVATLYRVPSRAMEDTLHVGDYLLLDKLHQPYQLFYF